MSLYADALTKTDRNHMNLVQTGSDTERRAVQQFVDLLTNYSPERIAEVIPLLYAPDAFFRDSFTEWRGAQAIAEYFMRSAQAVDECSFVIQDVAEHEGNYYFRWKMTLRLARYKDQPADESVGMSHIRLNESGQIVFQQDFWDTINLADDKTAAGEVLRWPKRHIPVA